MNNTESSASNIFNLIFCVAIVFVVIVGFYKLATSNIISNFNGNNKKNYNLELELDRKENKEMFDYEFSRTLEINNFKFKTEIVDNESDRKQGLSDTQSLCDECAMLFIFDKPQKLSFWMKDMNYDLDILYIKEEKNKKVVSEIFENVKADLDKSVRPVTVNSGEEVKYVLEINSGKASELNIKVGDEIIF